VSLWFGCLWLCVWVVLWGVGVGGVILWLGLWGFVFCELCLLWFGRVGVGWCFWFGVWVWLFYWALVGVLCVVSVFGGIGLVWGCWAVFVGGVFFFFSWVLGLLCCCFRFCFVKCGVFFGCLFCGFCLWCGPWLCGRWGLWGVCVVLVRGLCGVVVVLGWGFLCWWVGVVFGLCGGGVGFGFWLGLCFGVLFAFGCCLRWGWAVGVGLWWLCSCLGGVVGGWFSGVGVGGVAAWGVWCCVWLVGGFWVRGVFSLWVFGGVLVGSCVTMLLGGWGCLCCLDMCGFVWGVLCLG